MGEHSHHRYFNVFLLAPPGTVQEGVVWYSLEWSDLDCVSRSPDQMFGATKSCDTTKVTNIQFL